MDARRGMGGGRGKRGCAADRSGGMLWFALWKIFAACFLNGGGSFL